MKTITFLLFTVLLLACSKSDDSDDSFTGTMEAIINGELVVFDYAHGNGHFDLDNSCIEPFGSITGSTEDQITDGHSISFHFDALHQGVGTYNTLASYIRRSGPYNNGFNYTVYSSERYCEEDQTYYMEEGEVTITSTDNDRYKGTFRFNLSYGCGDDVVVITDGKFDISQRLPTSCY